MNVLSQLGRDIVAAFLGEACPACGRRRTLRWWGFWAAGEFIAIRAACTACLARFDVDAGNNRIIGPLGTEAARKAQRAKDDAALFGVDM